MACGCGGTPGSARACRVKGEKNFLTLILPLRQQYDRVHLWFPSRHRRPYRTVITPVRIYVAHLRSVTVLLWLKRLEDAKFISANEYAAIITDRVDRPTDPPGKAWSFQVYLHPTIRSDSGTVGKLHMNMAGNEVNLPLPDIGARTHYVLTWDIGATTARAYINGSITSTASFLIHVEWTTTTNPLFMGRSDATYHVSSTNFELDEVAYYHSVLSSTSIWDHYSAARAEKVDVAPAPFSTGAHCDSPVAAAYRKAVLADSPAGYWPLDGCNGVAVDASGNGRDGAVQGSTSPVVFGEGSLLPSGNGSSARFSANGFGDTTSQRIAVPGWNKRPSGVSGITLEFWLKRLEDAKFISANEYAAVITDRVDRPTDPPGKAWSFQVYLHPTIRSDSGTVGKLHMNMAGNEVNLPLPVIGARTHYALTWDIGATTARAYTNGVLTSTASFLIHVEWTTTTNPLFMGRSDATYHVSSTNFELDEVAYYHSVLSSTSIREHYKTAATDRKDDATSTTGSNDGSSSSSLIVILSVTSAVVIVILVVVVVVLCRMVANRRRESAAVVVSSQPADPMVVRGTVVASNVPEQPYGMGGQYTYGPPGRIDEVELQIQPSPALPADRGGEDIEVILEEPCPCTLDDKASDESI